MPSDHDGAPGRYVRRAPYRARRSAVAGDPQHAFDPPPHHDQRRSLETERHQREAQHPAASPEHRSGHRSRSTARSRTARGQMMSPERQRRCAGEHAGQHRKCRWWQSCPPSMVAATRSTCRRMPVARNQRHRRQSSSASPVSDGSITISRAAAMARLRTRPPAFRPVRDGDQARHHEASTIGTWEPVSTM